MGRLFQKLAIAVAALPALGLPIRAQDLANPGFEEEGSALAGWSVQHGAGNPQGTPSIAESSDSDASEGRRALRLFGDAKTWSWQFVSQRTTAEAGARHTLRFSAKSQDVRHEGKQFLNAYVALAFYDGAGELLNRQSTPMLMGTRDWSNLVLQAIAPESTESVEVAAFLSVSGTLWVDNVRLLVTPTSPFDMKVREAAFDSLEGHLHRSYPFFGLGEKPLPDKLFEKHRSKVVKQKELRTYAEALGKMLDELDDLHVYLRVDGDTIFTGPRGNPNPTNWNMEFVDGHISDVVSRGKNHLVARLSQGFGYVRLTSFGAEWDEIKATDAAMDRLADVPGWILDVRPNGGGQEDKATHLAARFIDERTEYARSRYRDAFRPEDFTAFTENYPRWMVPREGREPDPRPVIVLQGPFCVSSTEGFLLMMAAVPTATLVGMPSRGASANPAGFTVVPGLEVVASRWQSLTLDDQCIEGIGVQPDVLIDARPSKYVKGDPTFERALDILGAE